jgi:rhamnogalacturonan endolyase
MPGGSFILALSLAIVSFAAEPAATVTQTDKSFTLANGYLTAQVDSVTGDLTSLQIRGIELMGYASGHHAGHWEQSPARAARLEAKIAIDPKSNGGERAEVSIKGYADGKPLSGMICDLEIRYAIARGDKGLYTYAIFSHPAAYGATQIGESRFGAKLSAKVFDWLSIDDKRNTLMPTGADWDHGAALNMKEARRLTTGHFEGRVEHKYDYSAVQSEIPAFGWASTKEKIGLYFINPSMEYLSSGPLHPELTGHLDDNAGGDPTLLDYWRGTHYGGSILPIDAGEEWSKVIGPIFVYVNEGSAPEALFQDARRQVPLEQARWPYDWVSGVDYPLKKDRATVTGQIALNDPLVKSTSLLRVGLAYPDDARLNWQNDAKHYEFWTVGDASGHFRIPNVRPGKYQLHAIADGVFGELAGDVVTIEPGKNPDLGTIEWKPIRYGKQIWEIGIPNRSGVEFFKGDEYFKWGWYLEYAKLFPGDVTYTIGKSDYRKDWFFEQVPHAINDDGTGRAQGRPTTWTIRFTMPTAPAGKATLRLGLCGVSARSIQIGVNGQTAGTITGLVYNATLNRDGIAGSWVEKNLAFDAALLTAGDNTLTLTIPGGGVTSGIIYDYLRLEIR